MELVKIKKKCKQAMEFIPVLKRCHSKTTICHISNLLCVVQRLPFVHPDHIHLVATVCFSKMLQDQENAISDKAKSWMLYVRTWQL